MSAWGAWETRGHLRHARARGWRSEVAGRDHHGSGTLADRFDEDAQVRRCDVIVVPHDGSFEPRTKQGPVLADADVCHVDLDRRAGRPRLELQEVVDRV